MLAIKCQGLRLLETLPEAPASAQNQRYMDLVCLCWAHLLLGHSAERITETDIEHLHPRSLGQ